MFHAGSQVLAGGGSLHHRKYDACHDRHRGRWRLQRLIHLTQLRAALAPDEKRNPLLATGPDPYVKGHRLTEVETGAEGNHSVASPERRGAIDEDP